MAAALLVAGALMPAAQAQNTPTETAAAPETRQARWYVQTSVATRHFNPDPAHVNNQQLIKIERISHNEFLYGFAAFRNSFGQPTEFLYIGQRWHPLERFPGMHLKLTAGLLHGYRDEYRDKIPFNKAGTAPVLLPAVGYSYKKFASEVVVFGNSGVMLTLGYYLD
jgi:hypothetical protein